jgi:hypothetical protein
MMKIRSSASDKVVSCLEMEQNKCVECGRSKMFHRLKPLECPAMVGMLRARLGL